MTKIGSIEYWKKYFYAIGIVCLVKTIIMVPEFSWWYFIIGIGCLTLGSTQNSEEAKK